MVSAVGGMAAFGGGNNICEGRSPHGLRPRNPLFSVVAPLPELLLRSELSFSFKPCHLFFRFVSYPRLLESAERPMYGMFYVPCQLCRMMQGVLKGSIFLSEMT